MLGDLGARVLEFPTIDIQPPQDFDPLDKAIRELDSFDWLVFTSVNGVDAFLDRLGHHALDVRAVPRAAKIAAIGPATADRIRATVATGGRGAGRVPGGVFTGGDLGGYAGW